MAAEDCACAKAAGFGIKKPREKLDINPTLSTKALLRTSLYCNISSIIKMKFALVALIAGSLVAVAAAAPADKRQTSTCTTEDMAELSALTSRFETCRSSTCSPDQSGCECCSNRDTNSGSSQCCVDYRSLVALYEQCRSSTGNKRQIEDFLILAGSFVAGCVIEVFSRDSAVTSSLSTGTVGLCAVAFTSAKVLL